MEIKYVNRLQDQMAFQTRAIFTRKALMTLILCAVGCITYTTFSGHPIDIVTIIAASVFFVFHFIILIVAILVLTTLLISIQFSTNGDPGFYTEHRLTFDQEGYTEETKVNKCEGKWEGVSRIAKGMRHIYLYEGPNRAHIIPRRAFTSEADYSVFFAKLNELWKCQQLASSNGEKPPR